MAGVRVRKFGSFDAGRRADREFWRTVKPEAYGGTRVMGNEAMTKSVALPFVRAVLAAVMAFGLPVTSTWAQGVAPVDPIIGTWKLDPALTKRSPGMPIAPPPARTETYRQDEAGQIELAISTPNPTGSTTSLLVFSALGGVVTEGAPAGQMLIETRLAPGDWLVTYLRNGVQFLTMRKTVSSDRTSSPSRSDERTHAAAMSETTC
jgi:hypothetical protein